MPTLLAIPAQDPPLQLLAEGAVPDPWPRDADWSSGPGFSSNSFVDTDTLPMSPQARVERNTAIGPPIVIFQYEELAAFAASGQFWSKKHVLLKIPAMSGPEAFEASERLNKDRHECGCGAGAQAMFAGLLLALAALVFRYGLWTSRLLVHLPLALLAAFLSAALGKITGIAVGHRRARRTVARLLAGIRP